MHKHFKAAIWENPSDALNWSAYADWLSEQDDPRGELLHIRQLLISSVEIPQREQLEACMIELISQGVQPIALTYTNSIGMEFVLIPPGEFVSEISTPSAPTKEVLGPRKIKVAFLIGKYLVTRRQFIEVMSPTRNILNSFQFDFKQMPADNVSHIDPFEFIVRLHQRETEIENEAAQENSEDGELFDSLIEAAAEGELPYRLPTNLQWEYACRAGTTSDFNVGDSLSPKQANITDDSEKRRTSERSKPTPVGTYLPNALGLFDMHGNLREWCIDSVKRKQKSLRGGSFASDARMATSHFVVPSQNGVSSAWGFRLALEYSPELLERMKE